LSLDVSPSRKRGPFLFIGVIALVSLGLAYGLFWMVSSGWFSFGTTNHGKFVEPRTLASSFNLVDAQGRDFDTGGDWSLWFVTQGECASSCRERLDELRKLHVLLNREASRVQRYLVAPQLHSLTTELGEPNAQLKRLEGVRVAQLTTGVYIVDR